LHEGALHVYRFCQLMNLSASTDPTLKKMMKQAATRRDSKIQLQPLNVGTNVVQWLIPWRRCPGKSLTNDQDAIPSEGVLVVEVIVQERRNRRRLA
jgi:hypothetical protein